MSEKGLSGLLPRQSVKGFAARTAARYASGTLWPHGEWSLGYGKERVDGGEWHEDPYVGMGVDDTEVARLEARGALDALYLSDAPNSRKRHPRGLHGITGYGQQMVKAAGHLMQEKWPHHRKTLGTITLPPMSRATRAEVVAQWPNLVRELLLWQHRKLRQQGLPPVVVSVSEIQPKRLAESGQACLHLHQLWLNVPAKSGHWSFDPNEIRTYFERLLRRFCPSYEGGHINVNTKAVEGVVAAYLAKYMSKGKQMIAEALQDWGEGNCPRTWWNMTKPARDMVKACTHKGREAGALLETILHHARDTDVDMHYAFLRPIDMEHDGVRYTVGYRGRFWPELSGEVRSMLKSLDIERFGVQSECPPNPCPHVEI